MSAAKRWCNGKFHSCFWNTYLDPVEAHDKATAAHFLIEEQANATDGISTVLLHCVFQVSLDDSL